MKYAYSLNSVTYSFYKWYWDQAVEWAGVTQYEGLEIPYRAWTFNDGRCGAPLCKEALDVKYGAPENYAQFVKDCGLKEGVPSFAISASNLLDAMFQMGMPPDMIFDRMLEHGKEALKVLYDMGGEALVISISPSIGILKGLRQTESLEEIKEWLYPGMADVVNEIQAQAEELGISVFIRNEYYGATRGENIIEFLDLVGSKVGFSPDLIQLQIAEANIEMLINRYRDRLGCVVFSDTAYKDEVNAFESLTPEHPAEGDNQRVYCEMGQGKMPLTKYHNLLKDLGYDGWVVLETKSSFDYPVSMLKMAGFRKKNFND